MRNSIGFVFKTIAQGGVKWVVWNIRREFIGTAG